MPIHIIMIGGFLGAGKTTALLQLARHLTAQGHRVGLVTNDQSQNLVDTARVQAAGFPVEEVTGGCFCCHFNSLLEALQSVAAPPLTQSSALSPQHSPDILLAEPVGSCTDLRATVAYPLRQLYADQYTLALLSVLIDPLRAARVLGLSPGKSFSDKVLYIYRHQLAEADLLILNKTDLVPPPDRAALRTALAQLFPQIPILEVSCLTAQGLPEWFARLTPPSETSPTVNPRGAGQMVNGKWKMENGESPHPAPPIDYPTYAAGEALLVWLNARATLTAPTPATPFDPNAYLLAFAATLQQSLAAQNIEIAHLKMTLSPASDALPTPTPDAMATHPFASPCESQSDPRTPNRFITNHVITNPPSLASVSLTRTDSTPMLTHSLPALLPAAVLTINLRAEADPTLLESALRRALITQDSALSTQHSIQILHAFRPPPPTPTHRLSSI